MRFNLNTFFAIFLVLGLVMSAILVGGAFPATNNNTQNPYFSNLSNVYCSGYGVNHSCYSDNGTGQFDIFNVLLQSLSGWNLALTALVSAVFVIGIVTGALNLLALIPFGLAFVALNFLILPTGLLTNTGLPEPIPFFLSMFFYMLAIMAALSFTRTGQ